MANRYVCEQVWHPVLVGTVALEVARDGLDFWHALVDWSKKDISPCLGSSLYFAVRKPK